ncbi:MAG: hypothetical protein HQL55_16670 [Magnetococcales bacterium]|nr:hypothetical protein [Magnetococcales bacterium]
MLKAFRDNLGLLSLVVVLIGVSSTDAYYGAFGLKYQLLSIPANHLLYRGLTSVFDSFYVSICYIASVFVIVCQGRLAVLFGSIDRVRFLNYAFVIVISIISWFSGLQIGRNLAMEDYTVDKSNLPMVQKILYKKDSNASEIDGAVKDYRILLQTNAGFYLLRPVKDPHTESPLIQYISGGSIEVIKYCIRC